jgi:hypothetical protein
MLAYVRIDGDGDGVSDARGFFADADANEDGKVRGDDGVDERETCGVEGSYMRGLYYHVSSRV